MGQREQVDHNLLHPLIAAYLIPLVTSNTSGQMGEEGKVDRDLRLGLIQEEGRDLAQDLATGRSPR